MIAQSPETQLNGLSKSELDRIKEKLNYPTPRARRDSVEKIRRHRLVELLPVIASLAIYDRDVDVRASAIGTIGEIGPLESLNLLNYLEGNAKRQKQEHIITVVGQAIRKLEQRHAPADETLPVQ